MGGKPIVYCLLIIPLSSFLFLKLVLFCYRNQKYSFIMEVYEHQRNNIVDEMFQVPRSSFSDSILNIEEQEVPVITSLADLVKALHEVFKEDRVNVDYVKYLMYSYKSNPAEWRKFAKFDRYRCTGYYSYIKYKHTHTSRCENLLFQSNPT